jgi:putative hydrolase of the HAD superfamily
MKFEIVSFDLQGTLSDSAFSDEFWMETLPELYSESRGIPLGEAKEELKELFKGYGKYDFRYYSFDYWMKELGLDLTLQNVMKHMKNKPLFFEEWKEFLSELKGKYKLIICSSTTKEFIQAELGENKGYFDYVFSSIDDLGIAGKPKDFYEKVLEKIGVPAERVIHIGDMKEMDIDNAKKAGLEAFCFDKSLPKKKIIKKLRHMLC